MYVLREKKSKKALGLSYTEEGLKLTANKVGRLLYYKSAVLNNNNGKISVSNNIEKNPNVIIEKFKPLKFESKHLQKCENLWVRKAKQMTY